MRDLTRFECSSISGGTVNTHIIIPTAPMTKEEGLIVLGVTGGMIGGLAGAFIGLANNWSGAAIIASGAAGTVVGAFGLPVALTAIGAGLTSGYRMLGLID